MSLEARKTAPVSRCERSPQSKRRRSDNMDTRALQETNLQNQGSCVKERENTVQADHVDKSPQTHERPPMAPKRPHGPSPGDGKPSSAEKRGRRNTLSPGLLGVEDEIENQPGSARRKSPRRKSKRRSSFVMGRISKTVPTADGAELYKTIPAELDEHVRLEILARRAVEFSLNKLQEEFPDLPEFDQFRIKAMDAAGSAIDEMRDSGLLHQLVDTQHDSSQHKITESNEEGSRLQDYIDKALEETDRYKRESEAWDALVQNFQAEAEKAERLGQVDHVIREPPTGGLSKKQQAFLNSAPNYAQFAGKLEHMQQTTTLAVAEISRAAKKHEKIFIEARNTAEMYAQAIYEAAFPNSSDDELLCAFQEA